MQTIPRFFLLAAFLALPLAAQPFPLATPPVGPTAGDVQGAHAASNGRVYLAVWSELRLGVVQIRGIHVSTDGVPVEASSFRISPDTDTTGEGLVSAPAVASDGTNFVVVWASRSQLFSALVPASSGNNIRVTPTNVDARSVKIVWSSTAYVVLRETSKATLAATLIDFDGTLLFAGTTVATSTGGLGSPALAVNKSGRAMAFYLDFADKDAHVADVSTDRVRSGGVSSVALQSPRPFYGEGTIASDGSGFLAVWSAYPATQINSFSILSRAMDSTGASSGPVQTVAASSPALVHPLLFWNGQKYLLIDANGAITATAITAQAINGDGTPTPAGPYIITTHSGSAKEPAALVAGDAFGITKTFLLWRDFRFGHAEAFGQVGDTDANPISDEIVVSRSPADQIVGAAVWTGSDYLTVWTERDGVSRIVAARANERVPIVIAGPQLTGSTPGSPALAVAHGQAVIVWIDVAAQGVQQTTLFRSTLGNGAQSASLPALITTDVRNDAPAIASNGQNFAVVWTTLQGEIAATTIDAGGNSSTSPVTLTVKPSDTVSYSSPRLAWDGTEYVLARQRTLNDGRTILEAQRLSSALTLIGAPLQLTDSLSALSVSIAGSPSGVLVTWVQLTSVNNRSPRAARITSTLIDPINGITLVPGDTAKGPVAGWDGRNWRIGIGNLLVTLPPAGGVQQPQTIASATRIGAVAGGGPRLFIAFDSEDSIERSVRAYGQFIIDPPVRRHAVNPR